MLSSSRTRHNLRDRRRRPCSTIRGITSRRSRRRNQAAPRRQRGSSRNQPRRRRAARDDGLGEQADSCWAYRRQRRERAVSRVRERATPNSFVIFWSASSVRCRFMPCGTNRREERSRIREDRRVFAQMNRGMSGGLSGRHTCTQTETLTGERRWPPVHSSAGGTRGRSAPWGSRRERALGLSGAAGRQGGWGWPSPPSPSGSRGARKAP